MSNQNRRDSFLLVALGVIAIAVLLPFLLMLFWMPMMGGMMGWWGGGGSGMGISPLWGIGMMLLLLVVVLALGYFLYQSLAGSQRIQRRHNEN